MKPSPQFKKSIKELDIEEIRTDGDTQMRAGLNPKILESLTTAIALNHSIEHISVVNDGEKYWLVDGFHRLKAHRLEGRKVVEAIVTHGDIHDARLAAASANNNHDKGNNYTNADKQRAVESLLENPRCVGWSDRKIAEHAHVTAPTVESVRKQIQQVDSTVKNLQLSQVPETTSAGKAPTKKTGRDGKSRDSSNNAKAGKRKAADNALAKLRTAPDMRALEDAYTKLRAPIEDGVMDADTVRAQYVERKSQLEITPCNEERVVPIVRDEPSSSMHLLDQQKMARNLKQRCIDFENRLVEFVKKLPLDSIRDAASRSDCETALYSIARLIAAQIPARVQVTKPGISLVGSIGK
jgi:ParB-like chromosome segregation protein Spo0J